MLERAEPELLELASALDRPFERRGDIVGSMVLAHRSRTVYRGFLACVRSAEPLAAQLMLRSLVEANITARFITQRDSDVRFELWSAEHDRLRLSLDSELRELARRLPRYHSYVLTNEERRAIEAALDEARRLALEHAVPGVREKRGPVFPGIDAQVHALRDPAVSEAYTIAYRPLSADTHMASTSFRHGELEIVSDEMIRYTDRIEERSVIASRALAASTFASTLCIASVRANLGIEERADEIKRGFVPHDAPITERLARGS